MSFREGKDDRNQALFPSEIPVHSDINCEFQRVRVDDDLEETSDEIHGVCSALLAATKMRNKYLSQNEAYRYLERDRSACVEHEVPFNPDPHRRRPEPLFEPFSEYDAVKGRSRSCLHQAQTTTSANFNSTSTLSPSQLHPARTALSMLSERPAPIKPEGAKLEARMENGVMVVFIDKGSHDVAGEGPVISNALHRPPLVEEFITDLMELTRTMYDAATKSFTYKRLQLLEARFKLHTDLNGKREGLVQKAVPHRDFYNVRKVDTHIHHSAIMNQKHLLNFIKTKLKRYADEIVIHRDGQNLTLAEVFRSINMTAYDLSIDTLDMHADNTFHRFDRFNLKYNPVGESRLREIFLKSDNLIAGRYLAEITREVFDDAEANKYVFLEPRVSIYGRKRTEWSKLGRWYCRNRLASPNVRWMVQVPRLYSVYKKLGLITCFQDMLDNIFIPLFEVVLRPSSDPELACFLKHLVGVDCVDDESKHDALNVEKLRILPCDWDYPENPPYAYWIYYLYANLQSLNHLRAHMHELRSASAAKKKRLPPLIAFRPHAGEAGDLDHLAATFLCADHINHGILLRRSPTLQYLYYLEQIGLAVSPLSNNKLFLDYNSNPFPVFFARGLNVSLSTDDPLMLHITKEPLVEEYSVASQVWKFSATDMCEIARASVLQSGFEHVFKRHFLGDGYWQPGAAGNDIKSTNIPDIRVIYRQETLDAEWEVVRKCAAK